MTTIEAPLIAKVCRLRVSQKEATLTMDEWITALKAALEPLGVQVTSLGEEYIVDGQLVPVAEWESDPLEAPPEPKKPERKPWGAERPAKSAAPLSTPVQVADPTIHTCSDDVPGSQDTCAACAAAEAAEA